MKKNEELTHKIVSVLHTVGNNNRALKENMKKNEELVIKLLDHESLLNLEKI